MLIPWRVTDLVLYQNHERQMLSLGSAADHLLLCTQDEKALTNNSEGGETLGVSRHVFQVVEPELFISTNFSVDENV